ncbi:MAG: glutamate 5-kinase [Oscillospiraceae bacterium]|nr:glutamate 5-kinase [Oscillospiraceae bacterium]
MLRDAGCIVFKAGTSTLIHDAGKINLKAVEEISLVLSDLANSGRKVVLVTSGAIGAGVGKLGLGQRPTDTAEKQAVSTIGQCELMFMYDKMFGQYSRSVGQLLITKADFDHPDRRENLLRAIGKLFEYGAVPIVNENDAVAVDEIVYGDNDSLSAAVAKLISADALVILTETDGMYDSNPATNPGAKRIPFVREITDELRIIAEKTMSGFGTGGMATKLLAAEAAALAGIDAYVISGKNPRDNIYALFEGADIGTHFIRRR